MDIIKSQTMQENNINLTGDNLSLRKQYESIRKELNELHSHVEGIEQYLQVNNNEVVGLLELNDDRNEEKIINRRVTRYRTY